MLQLILLLGAVGVVSPVSAAYCGGYYGYYNCDGGLSTGARIGIGIGIAAGVLLLFGLCSYWRRKQLRNQFSKYRPPALPFTQSNNQSSNPYASNPPPPPAQSGSYYNQSSNWQNNQYGQNPSAPANVYQPSMAGAYGNRDASKENGNGNLESGGDHEHGYEWAQAREAERLERDQSGTAAPPPGYEVSSNPTGSTTYTPPPGPPPKNVVS